MDVPEKALVWLPLGLGFVVEEEPSELLCSKVCIFTLPYFYCSLDKDNAKRPNYEQLQVCIYNCFGR